MRPWCACSSSHVSRLLPRRSLLLPPSLQAHLQEFSSPPFSLSTPAGDTRIPSLAETCCKVVLLFHHRFKEVLLGIHGEALGLFTPFLGSLPSTAMASKLDAPSAESKAESAADLS